MNSAPATTVPQSPYPNAPIIEAVIEIRVEYSDAAAAAVHRAAFVASLSSEFPRKETMQRHEIQVEVSPEGPPQVGKKETAGGWRLFNEKSDRVLVLLSDTFAYSHMPPYTRWETFRSECEPLWERFVAACGPSRVSRLAVRNINRLKFPQGKIDLHEYLRMVPDVPEAIGIVNSLLFQIQVLHPSIAQGCQSFLRLASETAIDPQFQPLILDIGVVSEGSWRSDDRGVWEQLTQLRDKKNELFEACITDSTRRMFA